MAVASFREQRVIAVLQCLVVLLLIVFMPSAARYHYSLSSLAPGVVIASAALIVGGGLGLLGRVPAATVSNGLLVGGLVLLAIVTHLGLSLFQYSADLGRAFASLGALALMLGAAPVIYQIVFKAEDQVLQDTLAIVRVAIVVMVLMALVGLQPFGEISSERPIWPFTEPSHFALAAAPFLIHGCVVGGRWERWFWLAFTAFAVIALKSVSLGVALVLAAVCSLTLLEVGIFAAVAAIGLGFLDLTYFVDRLAIGQSSTNLSALVYLQGLELFEEALEKTAGWGIAFQQLGFAPTNVLTTELIRRIGGGEQNLADGSFLAVKLGAEFGWFGIAILLGYLGKLAKVLIDLRLLALRRASGPAGVTFAMITFVSLFVELFVRGVGYFSGTALLAAAGLGLVMRVRLVERPRLLRTSYAA